MKVGLKDIRLERLRDFGDVWLGWGLWRMLGLDGLLTKLLPEGREDVSGGMVAGFGRRCVAGFGTPNDTAAQARTDTSQAAQAAR